ncbi:MULTISPECIES: hypothetical protein [Pseudarthrobacter]|uniref:hypothetical protein n=1 Tax=Pseudarthrobacter TaxID=1742993 RepID=UPI0013DA7B8F|nr:MULTISPECIES: hypothetical protein [Pseudarthrobacter]MDP9996788.1 hypothetical protein [Pseudarthrobacter sulfonivorans]
MEAVSARKAKLYAASWFLITVVAYGISGVTFHFPGSFPPNNGEAFNWAGIAGAVVNGLGTGILVGISQRYLIRKIIPNSWRWSAVSTFALWLIHAVGDTFPDSVALPLIFNLGGLVIGALQWWAVRWPARYGLTWLAASALSWSVGLWLCRVLVSGGDWRTEHLVTGLLGGLVIGVVTAGAWLWILSDHASLSKQTLGAISR